MSDNSSSTGSSSSSTNSWTLLSPEDGAVESLGPVDDGTESLGDVPSLSEEVAGAAAEFKPCDATVETVLSEEGHQVCQETSPESSEGPIPSSPAGSSPLPHTPLDCEDLDLESQPPIIHEIDTSSPSDNEQLGATPFVTNINVEAQLDVPLADLPPLEFEEPFSVSALTSVPICTAVFDKPADVDQVQVNPAEERSTSTAEPEVEIPTATTTATDAPPHVDADISSAPETTELQSPESLMAKEEEEEEGEEADGPPAPETVGAVEEEEEQQEEVLEDEAAEKWETEVQEEEEEPSISFDSGDTGGFDDGLRRRNVPFYDAHRPRTSDEEEEEEEVEFKLEKKEEKPWFSLNKCIVGAVVLLFLGSLFLSGDFDASEVSDGEQSQDWPSGDPQEMKELLDKLTQENQHIALLEAQLKSQKEELTSALQAVAESGDQKRKADLEKENARLKEELSSLPELRRELESLRARVTEVNQLTADQTVPQATPGSLPQPADEEVESSQKAAAPERSQETSEGAKVKDGLQRQKLLLEESRKRLEGMKHGGGSRRDVRESLEVIQQKLSDRVERWEKKKPQDFKWKGNKEPGKEKEHWRKEGKKEWKGEKEWKHNKDGGRKDKGEKKDKEWKHGKDGERKDKEEKKEKVWKHGEKGGWKDKEEKKEKEWKPQKHNSHKEAWRKHQDEWEKRKDERRMDREERRKEKPWHSQSEKDHSHHHHSHNPQHHRHQPRQTPQPHHNDFWRDQEQKLRRNLRPQLGCSSVEDCAGKEGLYAVELSEFEELLEGYLSKLEGSSSESKDKIRKLTAGFFEEGVFVHDRVLFSDFAEDIADILEDMVDVLEDNDSLEEEMEEFEREALWKFAVTA